MKKQPKTPFDLFAFIVWVIIYSLLALLFCAILVFIWNGFNDLLGLKLSLNFWWCFLLLEIPVLFLSYLSQKHTKISFDGHENCCWNSKHMERMQGFWENNE
jgi:hypothetical protein